MPNFKSEQELPQQGLSPEDSLPLDSMRLENRDEVIQKLRIKYAHDTTGTKTIRRI